MADMGGSYLNGPQTYDHLYGNNTNLSDQQYLAILGLGDAAQAMTSPEGRQYNPGQVGGMGSPQQIADWQAQSRLQFAQEQANAGNTSYVNTYNRLNPNNQVSGGTGFSPPPPSGSTLGTSGGSSGGSTPTTNYGVTSNNGGYSIAGSGASLPADQVPPWAQGANQAGGFGTPGYQYGIQDPGAIQGGMVGGQPYYDKAQQA